MTKTNTNTSNSNSTLFKNQKKRCDTPVTIFIGRVVKLLDQDKMVKIKIIVKEINSCIKNHHCAKITVLSGDQLDRQIQQLNIGEFLMR